MNNTKPNINVTPLIDVLLVLLIIFMVIAPIKPTDFKAKIPQESKQDGEPNIHTLIVALNSDYSLRLNTENDLGIVEEPEKLILRLSQIFKERTENRVYSENAELNNDLTEDEKIEKTVFIKAPRTIGYGSVAKVIDAVKLSGANPISLQIDDLE
ncbi:MAG: biopolymer transporter ExbD [Acidobacteria bacterium]|jgi:biopolymer transport protein ExbD|nr:biopolymer transporter ExbD [Acidobacteriota bacterium]